MRPGCRRRPAPPGDRRTSRPTCAPGEVYLVHGGAGGIGHAWRSSSAQGGRRGGGLHRGTPGQAGPVPRARRRPGHLLPRRGLRRHHPDFTEGRGADVILDIMGAPYLARNLAALATWGRLVVISRAGRAAREVDLGLLMHKRASICARHPAGPAAWRKRPRWWRRSGEHVWPLISAGRSGPVIEPGAADGRGGAGAPAVRRGLARREDSAGQLSADWQDPGCRSPLRGRRKTRTMSMNG